MNEDIRALKDALENQTHTGAHQEGSYQVFFRKILRIMNLSQNLSSKLFSALGSRSIR